VTVPAGLGLDRQVRLAVLIVESQIAQLCAFATQAAAQPFQVPLAGAGVMPR